MPWMGRGAGRYEKVMSRVYDGMHEHLSETPGAVRGPAPLLGEANEYVFRELLGLGEEEINQGYIEGLFS